MAEYIDVEKLKRNIRVNLMPNVDIDGTVTVENAERYFINLIDKTSKADVVEVKRGHWIEDEVCVYTCSECGFTFTTADDISEFKYCRCGADMRGEIVG